MIAGITVACVWVFNSTLGDDYPYESEVQFEADYGSRVDDFYYISDQIQARWLTEVEDKDEPCVINKHCVHIKIASVAHCEKGSVLEFSVLDSNSKVLGTHESEVFMVKKGEIIQLELGSTLLTEKGFVEPLDAYCKDLLPEV